MNKKKKFGIVITSDMPEVKRKIGLFILQNRIGPDDLLEAIDATQSSFNQWMSGKRIPSSEKIKKIVEITHGFIQPNDFYETKLT